jgi:hypothetical protein
VPMAEIRELGPDLGVELVVRLRHGLDHAPPLGDRRPGAHGKAADNWRSGCRSEVAGGYSEPGGGAHPPADVRTVWQTKREAR